MKQYSKRMVVIHWLTLIMVILAWYLGDSLDEARHEKSATLIGYLAHAMVGGIVLLMTVFRWIFRGVDGTPPPVGNSMMDLAAKGVHHLLYLLLFLLPATGFMTILASGVGMALLAGDASMLPTKYTGPGILPHTAHEILMNVLIVAVVVHVLGAIKHQFIMKNGLMERMSLRRK